MTEIRGRIFDIQRFSIHDGPGIRTTVFMQGCSLNCKWCHNPEGIPGETLLSFIPDKCIGCGFCFETCRKSAHRMDGGMHVLDRSLCDVCGRCTAGCYAGALELIGKEADVEEVIGEVLRDRPFYETSGGGITLSGGEPMHQAEFTEALLRRAVEENLHTCMETCGFARWEHYERVLSLTDLFLADVKEMDPQRHREYTGVDNAIILENIERLHDAGRPVMLRLPLIPGYNDREDHFAAVAAYAGGLTELAGVEIMPYHPLGTDKVKRLGLDRESREKSSRPDDVVLRRWIDFLEDRGVSLVNERPAAETNESKRRGTEKR